MPIQAQANNDSRGLDKTSCLWILTIYVDYLLPAMQLTATLEL